MTAASPEYIEYIKEKAEPFLDVETARFFGGTGLKHQGLQFGMIMGNTLYLCVDDKTRDDYIALDSQPFSYNTKKGKVFVRKYYSVPDDIIEDEESIGAWFEKALGAALRTKK